MITLTSKISSDLHERIRKFCEDKGITISEFVRKALLQGLQGVYPKGNIQGNTSNTQGNTPGNTGNTTKKGGNTMEDKDLLQVLKEIEALKLQRVQDRHDVERLGEKLERSIAELKEVVGGLEGSFQAHKEELEEGLKSVRASLVKLADEAGKIDRSSLAKGLEELCKSDPDNILCRIIKDEAKRAVEDAERSKTKGKISLDHETWEEVWSCPTCREGLVRQAIKFGAWEDILERAREEGLLSEGEEKKEDEEREEKRSFF